MLVGWVNPAEALLRWGHNGVVSPCGRGAPARRVVLPGDTTTLMLTGAGRLAKGHYNEGPSRIQAKSFWVQSIAASTLAELAGQVQ